MLFMTITIGAKRFYFEMKNNKKEYKVTLTDKGHLKTLTQYEVDKLFEFIFSGAKKYSHKENGYTVYVDEVNNKRYYKDGKEDYSLFFINNGSDATLYQEKNKNTNNSGIKEYILKNKKKMIYICCATLLAIKAAPCAEIVVAQEIANNTQTVEPITTEEALALIDSSPYLTEKEKNYFCNADYFEDVIRIAAENRSYELRKKLTNLNVKPFTIIDFILFILYDNIVDGYYNFIFDPSSIHLRNLSDGVFYRSAAHELDHLSQDFSVYKYVIEPSSSIVAFEYFGVESDSYYEAVANLRYLMEIIGPKPIIHLVYGADDSLLTQSIINYLGNEEGNKLLKEFKKRPEWVDHNKIRTYLDKMAKIKINNSSNERSIRNLLYYNRIKEPRFYFNQHAKAFSTPTLLINHVNKTYKNARDIIIKEVKYSLSEEIPFEDIPIYYSYNKYKESSIHVFYETNNDSKETPCITINMSDDSIEDELNFLRGKKIKKVILNFYTTNVEAVYEMLEGSPKLRLYVMDINGENQMIKKTIDGEYCVEKNQVIEIPSIDELFPEQVFVKENNFKQTTYNNNSFTSSK